MTGSIIDTAALAHSQQVESAGERFTLLNAELAARFGTRVGVPFSHTVAATPEALMNYFLRGGAP